MDALTGLKSNRIAVIIKVIGEENFARDAAYMGIVPGTVVFMLKNSPFKKHIEITLRGYILRIPKKDAKNIKILKTSSNRTFSPLNLFKTY